MAREVLMPKLGQTMEEGTIETWHKQEGDEVERGDVLFEVTTDKATLEVEAYATGVLRKIVAQEGETIPCNHLVAVIGAADEELPDIEKMKADFARKAQGAGEATPEEAPAQAPAAAPEPEPEQPPREQRAPQEPVPVIAPTQKVPEGRIFSSPRARMIARNEKVPYEILEGSGPNGRIIERDVRAYLDEISELKVTPTARELAFQNKMDLRSFKGTTGRIGKEQVMQAAGAAPAGAPAATAAAAAPSPRLAAAAAPGEEIPLSAMRKVIAQRMTESKQQVPHFYLFMDIDMGATSELRKKLNALGGPKVTFTDMIVKALADALALNPRVNVRYENGRLTQNAAVNISLAVSVEEGLFVPVIRDADKKGILQIASDRHELVEKARQSKLIPDDYIGGSVTLSNLGMFDVNSFLPIINTPESCIVGVGTISERVVAWQGGIHVRPMMTATLSGDHRATDGAVAAMLLKDFKALLEAPEKIAGGIA